MTARFITDPQDQSAAVFGGAGDEIYPNYWLSAGDVAGDGPFGISTAGSSSNQTVVSTVANTSSTLVVVTSGGITFDLLFDAAAMAAPASFRAGIEQAASMLSGVISDKITLNLNIHYSGTGGGAFAGPDSGFYESYSTIRNDLINNATPGDTTFNALPSGSSIQGQSNVAVWNAELKLWGFLGANDTTTDDGSATFATDINPNLLVGVALHELTHAMGRVPFGSAPDIFDLFRFASAGVRLFQGGNTAPASYFSVDGGNTKLADFGQNSDPSDFLNSGVQGSNDPFNEFYSGSTSQTLSTADKEILDALGFHTTAPVTTVIESFGSTHLTQVGNNYFLYNSGGSGPSLKYLGANIVVGQSGAWAPIGGEVTATGYEVAWKAAGADQYTVWNTDSNGNETTNTIGTVSGSSAALESLETGFHQDLNGDGVIGIPTPVAIEALGSTSLVQLGINYYLYTSGSGPSLKYTAAPVYAGEFGGWTPIGAEQTAGGYEVAWKMTGADQYTVWNTDSSGNFVSNTLGTVSGASTALESLEASFHQDLNGDGVIGIPATVIESFGSTHLTQVGNNYFLFDSTGSGPSLKYLGATIVAGQWGAIAPIGAEVTASGYEVAWKLAADSYTVWNTDSNGNDTTNTIGVVSGTSTALESLETSFHQDLNGDGVIGIPATVIESFGSTHLTQVGNNYFLFDSTGSGPSLKYLGATIVAGQWGAAIAPIGAEATATGYEVAWKLGANSYTVWNTDSNGNDTTNTVGIVSGTSTALESLETSFHQDLNGDGVIGIPAPQAPGVAPSNTVSQTHLVTVASNDTFVFGSATGAGANAESPDTTERGGSASFTGDQFAALFQDTPAGQPQTWFEPAKDGHGDTIIDSGHHDGIAQMIADLHASAVFIH